MKLKHGFLMAVLSMGAVASAVAEEFLPVTVNEIAVMNGRDDGKYDIFCTNGNREIVTDLDIRLNNVCPNLKSSKPTNILSLQKRSDGKFDIVCRDLRKLIATETELLKGDVCGATPPPPPKLVIEAGNYKVVSGYQNYYPHVTAPVVNNGVMTSIDVSIRENGWKCRFECQETRCQGRTGGSSCTSYKIEVLSNTQYSFATSNSDRAVFGKQ